MDSRFNGKKYILRKIENNVNYINKTQCYISKLFDLLFCLVTAVKDQKERTVKDKKNLNSLFRKRTYKYLRILSPSKVVPTEELPDCVINRVYIARGWCGQPSQLVKFSCFIHIHGIQICPKFLSSKKTHPPKKRTVNTFAK